MEYLDKKLEQYRGSGVYPFHMPGHKRKELSFANPYGIDITEIEGFDNLHHAEDILKEAQERAARVFSAEKTYYLINGSTCGLLSAISAATQKQDKILLARNCHAAAYHAAFLRELSVEYVFPKITSAGIQGAISPKTVDELLKEHKDIKAVVITSPTYDGVVSDVASIAEIAHAHGAALIVDEAHGAHFGFHEDFPKSALGLGADVVVQSLHKTLPSFTQTAFLHVQTDRISHHELERYLDIYETSSPSYLLMAGMDKCVRMLQEDGRELFCAYARKLSDFRKRCHSFRHIHVLEKADFTREEAFDFDPGKLIISVKGTDRTGEELYDILLKEYALQMEMASGFYVTAMTSIMDSEEGFSRLFAALLKIDGGCREQPSEIEQFIQKTYTKNTKDLEMYQAMSLPSAPVELERAIGQTSAEYVYLYPPGIPILVPGERVTTGIVENIKKCGQLGLKVQGLVDYTNRRINIVNF